MAQPRWQKTFDPDGDVEAMVQAYFIRDGR